MLISILKRKSNKHIAALLAILVVAVPFIGISSGYARQLAPIGHVKVVTPCQQSKRVQSQNTGGYCQNQSPNFNFYSILADLLMSFASITGKMYFLFVVGLLAASHHRRIYKPPRMQLSFA